MKILKFGIPLMAIFLISAAYKPAIADAKIKQAVYCKEPMVRKKDSGINEYWKYSAEKLHPNFVLDYYQDPDRNGVDISVVIDSTELIATYWKWEDVCAEIEDPEYGMKSNCTPNGGRKPGAIYQWENQCVQQPPETTYRSIDPNSISVWLDASRITRDLLGPGPYFQNSKKPVLRYLYPDQWALKVVRPGEQEIVERPGFKNPVDVVEFLKQNKDYIILESDAKAYILETRMRTTWSPSMSWPAISLVENSHCVAGVNTTGLDSGITALAGGERICGFVSHEYNGAVYRFVISFNEIPIDVPGEWYIGVGFYMRYAVFDGGNGHEPGYDYNYLEKVYSDESQEIDYSFESYILRSAPCNPDELGGCWDTD